MGHEETNELCEQIHRNLHPCLLHEGARGELHQERRSAGRERSRTGTGQSPDPVQEEQPPFVTKLF